MFCCEASEMFCELTNVTWLSICMRGSTQCLNLFSFCLHCSFKYSFWTRKTESSQGTGINSVSHWFINALFSLSPSVLEWDLINDQQPAASHCSFPWNKYWTTGAVSICICSGGAGTIGGMVQSIISHSAIMHMVFDKHKDLFLPLTEPAPAVFVHTVCPLIFSLLSLCQGICK